MPRPTPQTPARHLLLQVALLLALIGTLALAKAVSKYKIRAATVQLARPFKLDDLTLRLPANWTFKPPTRSHPTAPLVLQAREPSRDPALPGRILTVVRDRADLPQPPLEYLFEQGLLPLAYAPTRAGTGKLSLLDATPVADRTGFLAAGLRRIRVPSGQVLPVKDVVATAVLPSRDILTVYLHGLALPGQELADDLDLVKRVAAALSLPSPTLTPVDKLQLPTGPTVAPPPGFLPLPESDPHFTERHLLRASPPSRWTTLTLVPCLFLPDDRPESFRTMLTARDAEWLDAQITPLPTTRPTTSPTSGAPVPNPPNLRADLPLRAGLPFPRRAYLLTSPSGHALLIELRGGSPSDAVDWDLLVNHIASSATTPAGPPPTQLLANGARELARLAKVGLPSLLENAPQDQYFLWTHNNRPFGWSHLHLASAGDPTFGAADAHYLDRSGITSNIVHQFETAPDLTRHNESVTCSITLPTLADPHDRFQQKSQLADGQFTTALLTDNAPNQLRRATSPAPAAFLPGPHLALLLPHLPHDRELILRTTRLPGLELQTAPTPVTVRLRPTTQPATFTLDVSGTGQLLTLSPTHAALSRPLTRRPTTPQEIQTLFPRPTPPTTTTQPTPR